MPNEDKSKIQQPGQLEKPKRKSKLMDSEKREQAEKVLRKTRVGISTASKLVAHVEVADTVSELDKITHAATNVSTTTQAAVDDIHHAVNAIDRFFQSLEPIMHPIGIALNAIGTVLPPLRAAIVGLMSVITFIRSLLFAKPGESKAMRALKMGSAVVFTGLLIAIAIVPVLSIPLAIAVASVAIVKDTIEMFKNVYDIHVLKKTINHHKQLSMLKAELTQIGTHPEHEGLEEFVKERIGFMSAEEQSLLSTLTSAEKLAAMHNILDGQLKQESVDALEKELDKAIKSRNDKIAAVVFGAIGLVGVALMLTPFAPIGIGLLLTSSLGMITYKAAPVIVRAVKTLVQKIAEKLSASPNDSNNQNQPKNQLDYTKVAKKKLVPRSMLLGQLFYKTMSNTATYIRNQARSKIQVSRQKNNPSTSVGTQLPKSEAHDTQKNEMHHSHSSTAIIFEKEGIHNGHHVVPSKANQVHVETEDKPIASVIVSPPVSALSLPTNAKAEDDEGEGKKNQP